MNKDIIIKFNYQDSELVVFIENNQIKFGYQKDGEISTNLTKKQQEIIAKVYNTMTINKNTAIDCGIFKIKGKQIKIFFDMTSKLYFFYELIKNELKIPAKEDLIMLNMCYNNQEEYVKDKNHDPKLEDYPGQDKEKKEIKRFIKINTSVIAISLSLIIAFQQLPILDYGSYYLLNKPTLKTEKTIDDYSFEKIKQAVKSNNKLTEEEKAFVLYSLKDQLEENKEYIDTEMICENLSDLDIIYNKNPLKIDSVYGEAGGTYTTIGENKNDINLYRQPEYSLCLKKTLFHEINHSLTMYYPVSENLFAYEKNYLGEMANELVTYEYYDKISSNNLGEPNSLAYSLQMPIMYPLCEILDIETIKKFKYDNKVAYITEDLSKLDSDITKSYELITAINLIDLYEQNLYKASSKQDSKSFKQAKEEKKKNQEKIYNLIKYYYEKKYHKDMTEDQIMMLYFCQNGTGHIDEAYDKINSIYKIKTGNHNFSVQQVNLVPKGYISEKYKEKHPYVEIVYTVGNKKYTLNIDDSNRYSKERIPAVKVEEGEGIPDYIFDGEVEYLDDEILNEVSKPKTR